MERSSLHISGFQTLDLSHNVHFHAIGFQLIFCVSGWVRLVYEDQGHPFILNAGDCVIQPPRIRHRVLESGEGLEVVEIGVPAEHATVLDWEMELPTKVVRADREWEGQRFVHSKAADAVWGKGSVEGFDSRETGIAEGTKGVAGVQVLRPMPKGGDGVVVSHQGDILFTCKSTRQRAAYFDADFLLVVLSGSCTLRSEQNGVHQISAGDAYTVPPGYKTSLCEMSRDLSLLEVALPADLKTLVHHGEKL